MSRFNLLGVVLSLIFSLAVQPLGASPIDKVFITQIKTGGIVDGLPTEFVDIYNGSDGVISLDGWSLQYAKPSANIADCSGKDWRQQDKPVNVKEQLLSGDLAPATGLRIIINMNDNAGGSLRLSSAANVIDLVGWGNLVSRGVCMNGALAALPQPAQILRRLQKTDGEWQNSGDNGSDFQIVDSVSLGVGHLDDIPLMNLAKNIGCGAEGAEVAAQTTLDGDKALSNQACNEADQSIDNFGCDGIMLSEILPNPAGQDSNREYVELYNPTNGSVSLEGCQLIINGAIKQLSGILTPGYQALYGFTLPNATGGSIELVTNGTEEQVEYPAGLADDQAWALINGSWQLTNQPTPSAANILMLKPLNVATASSSSSNLADCPAGKYRNPDTNRCKTSLVTTAESLKPCAIGQERNPDTNRCRNVAKLSSVLKPCDATQIRNPETNRCRKVSTLKESAACKAGQERNPDTNRCRKVAGATTSQPSSSNDKSASKQAVNYGIFAAMAALVLGYGIYEYRTDIINLFLKLKK